MRSELPWELLYADYLAIVYMATTYNDYDQCDKAERLTIRESSMQIKTELSRPEEC